MESAFVMGYAELEFMSAPFGSGFFEATLTGVEFEAGAAVLAKIGGKEPEQVRARDYIKPVEKNAFKDQLKREAWNLQRTPRFAKAELVRIIEGAREDIDPKFLEGVQTYRSEIEKGWPEELRKFLFTVLEDLKTGFCKFGAKLRIVIQIGFKKGVSHSRPSVTSKAPSPYKV